MKYDYLREGLWLEGHWSTGWGRRHRNVLEARRDIITRADRVCYNVIALEVRTLSRLRLLGQHRSCDEGLLWRCLFFQRLLFVHFVDIIRFCYQTIIFIVFHNHASYCNRKMSLMLRFDYNSLMPLCLVGARIRITRSYQMSHLLGLLNGLTSAGYRPFF